jgi:hypothetical protein
MRTHTSNEALGAVSEAGGADEDAPEACATHSTQCSNDCRDGVCEYLCVGGRVCRTTGLPLNGMCDLCMKTKRSWNIVPHN